MSHRRSCGRQLTVCSLFWLEPVINEELVEDVAHDNVCVLLCFLYFFVDIMITMNE